MHGYFIFDQLKQQCNIYIRFYTLSRDIYPKRCQVHAYEAVAFKAHKPSLNQVSHGPKEVYSVDSQVYCLGLHIPGNVRCFDKLQGD